MDDFFKNFRDHLDRQPGPDFEERDWASFEKKLAPPVAKRRFVVGWWWLLLPVLGGSLLANVLLFREIKSPGQPIATVEIHLDTVILTKLIFETDTVFQSRIIYRTVVGASPELAEIEIPKTMAQPEKANPQAVETNGQFNKTDQKTDQNRPLDPFLTDSLFESPKMEAVPPAIVSAENPPVELSPLPDSTAAAPIFLKKKEARKTLAQQISGYRPTSFEAGVSAGTTVPFYKNVHWMPGPAVNLEAVAGFTPQLRMMLRGGFSKPKFESKTIEPALGIPEIDPPTDDFKLDALDAAQPSVHFSTEMQWVFRPKKGWKPVVGLGLGSAWRQQFQASYDFVNQLTGAEFIAEKTVKADATARQFGILSAGAERFFSKKWAATGRAAWQFPFGSGASRPPAFEFVAGLRYRF